MSADKIKNLAYIAGFIDGEGCIGLSSRRKGSKRHYIYLRVANTNRKVLDYMKKYFQVGSIQVANTTWKRPNNKVAYYYQVVCRKAVTILKLLIPFLKLKQKQAKLAIKFQSKIAYLGYYNKNSKLFNWQYQFYKKMRSLNKRGTNNVKR